MTLPSFQTQLTSQVILGTAVVDILNSKDKYQPRRAVLNSCFQCNAITKNLANSLGLKRQGVDIKLKGVQNLHSNVKYIIAKKIKSRHTDIEISLSCLIFKEISGVMPSLPLQNFFFQIPDGIVLADPNFEEPSEIDFLIGAEFFYLLLRSG